MSDVFAQPPLPSEIMLNDAYFEPDPHAFAPEERNMNTILQLHVLGVIVPAFVAIKVENAAKDARSLEQTEGTLLSAAETSTKGLVAVVLDTRYKARKGLLTNYGKSKIVSRNEFDERATEIATPFLKRSPYSEVSTLVEGPQGTVFLERRMLVGLPASRLFDAHELGRKYSAQVLPRTSTAGTAWKQFGSSHRIHSAYKVL